ncbi:conserved hypothetical protein [Lausannevirus]|uniref:Uncharacterized protein n=1 Tax=Lausannevirus TaxID=999883 RepID=F2WLK3_9VIRU|nr:hypothetical protein LAU_0275 [Lausannevirus]AEA07126.1 conserved hypothetical protein [Lausannevirus]
MLLRNFKDKKVQFFWSVLRILHFPLQVFFLCLFKGFSIHPNSLHLFLLCQIFLLGSVGGIDGKFVANGTDKISGERSESAIEDRAKFDETGLNTSSSRRTDGQSGSNVVLHRDNHTMLSSKGRARSDPERREVTIDTRRRSGSGKSSTDQMDVNSSSVTNTSPVALFGLGVKSDSGRRRSDRVSGSGKAREESTSGDGGNRSVY